MKQEKIVIPASAVGMPLLTFLAECGVFLSADCGGKGTCGKCRVKLLEGSLSQLSSPDSPLAPDADGTLLACQVRASAEGAVILLSATKGQGLTNTALGAQTGALLADEEWGIALDIGTTTLAMAGVGLTSKRIFATTSRLNPQKNFGADVMSRISASINGQLDALCRVVMTATKEMIEELKQNANKKAPVRMTVVGNPTMLHLFSGISPEGMGKSPFTPVFLETKVLSGKNLGLPVDEVTILPSISAFVGSDITAGMLLSRMAEMEKPSILMDIGTNGEIVLYTGKEQGDTFLVTSTAAGPALEGAGISCGMGGVSGAICHVAKHEDGFSFETIGNIPPQGICGSGLIDSIAYLRDTKDLDETGYLEDDHFVLEGDIALTQADIRQFQLAKSALRAGLETLIAQSGIRREDIGQLFLAGGLGCFLSIENAAKVGLLPPDLKNVTVAVGNSALYGGVEVLLCPQKIKDIEGYIAKCKIVELQNHPFFADAYMEHMFFPDTE